MLPSVSSPRQRFGSTKVRSGCVTCKARRVKCDEGKPSCQRCHKARRKCGGYTQGSAKPMAFVHYVASIDHSIGELPDLNTTERRALSVFQQNVAPELASQFCTDLYSRHLLIVAVHEEIVRDSVIALSTLYEQYFGVLHAAHRSVSEFALEHYGKAIKSMIKLNAKNNTSSMDVAILGCLVFASLEVLQGHYSSALTHFKSGIKLLDEYDSQTMASSGVYVPRILFRQAFVRIQTQCLEMGLMSVDDCPSHLNKCIRRRPIVHVSLSQAVVSMSSKFSRLLLFLQNQDAAVISPGAAQDRIDVVMERRREIIDDYVAWCNAFYTMAPHPEDRIEDVAICELYKTFIGILLRVDLRQGQASFDAFEKDFQDIVLLASIFLSRVSSILSKQEPRRINAELSVKTMATENDSLGMHPRTGLFFEIQADATPVCPGELPSIPPSRLQRPAMPILPQPGSFFKPTYVSVGLGIIAPLFSVSVRCRNTSIRRQALHLLKMSNRKEGMWDSMISGSVAQAIVESEMACVPGLTDDSPSSAIPEHARVQEVHANFVDPRRGVIYITRSAECRCSDCASNMKDNSSAMIEQIVDW